MDNEEAKRLYNKAIKRFHGKDYEGALALLEELDRERPNSRHVHYYLALCHVELGDPEKARESYQKLEGRLDEMALTRLGEAIEVSQSPGHRWRAGAVDSSSDSLSEKDGVVATGAAGSKERAMFQVSTAHPLSTNECSVTGFVLRGVFHVGDVAMVVSPTGDYLAAPVMRIGPADMPLNLARAGQRASLVLQIDPVLIGPGTPLACEPKASEAPQAAAKADRPQDSARIPERTSELANIERMVKQGVYLDAERMLHAYLKEHSGSIMARWLLAKVYMGEQSPVRDTGKALGLARIAYEAGTADDPSTTDTLAQALAENGDAETGLLLLERLYTQSQEMEAQRAMADRIHAFRAKYKLGEVWEFCDDYGEVILETRGPGEIVKAITSGILTADSLCRRNHAGDWQPLLQGVGAVYPHIGAMMQPLKVQYSIGFIVILIALGIAILIGLFLPQIALLIS